MCIDDPHMILCGFSLNCSSGLSMSSSWRHNCTKISEFSAMTLGNSGEWYIVYRMGEAEKFAGLEMVLESEISIN